MSSVFIYSLSDPRTKEIRYIGKSRNPRNRLRDHISYCRTEHTHKSCWILGLVKRGLAPVMEIVDETTEELWAPLEAAYIQFFRDQGCRLVNSTDGGKAAEARSGRRRI